MEEPFDDKIDLTLLNLCINGVEDAKPICLMCGRLIDDSEIEKIINDKDLAPISDSRCYDCSKKQGGAPEAPFSEVREALFLSILPIYSKR